MSTLIERLRSYSLTSGYAWHCHKAADEMERLNAEIETLRAALEAVERLHHIPEVSELLDKYKVTTLINAAIEQQKATKNK